MRNSKKIIITLALITSVMSPSFALAETNAGIKPGNIFYFFDITLEKVGMFFIFNSEKKADKALEHAEERLAEAQEVASENKPSKVARAMSGYEKQISFATEKSKDLDSKEKSEKLLNTISENTSRHQEVLESVLEKVPDEARDAILKAIEASKRGQEEALKQITELKGGIDQLKQEVAELKAKEEVQNKEIEELKKKADPVISTQKSSVVPTDTNNNQSKPQIQSPQPVIVETWEQIEARDFEYANARNWTSLTSTNSLGEKRYYRKEGALWIRKNSEAEMNQPYVIPPTSNQISRLRRLCLASPEVASVCADSNFMPGYYSNLTFRFLIDGLVDKYHAYLSSQEQQKISAEIKILDCLMAPTPEDQRVLDPATQNYLRQVRCGTITDADKTNYELSRIKSSVDELKYRLETKTSFPPVFLDTVEPTGFGTRWEIRWDGFGGGTITDSTGGFYQFRCETNYCVSY